MKMASDSPGSFGRLELNSVVTYVKVNLTNKRLVKYEKN